MTPAPHIDLPRRDPAEIMSGIVDCRARFALLVAVCLWAGLAPGQDASQGARDDLDVTMQIIVDPDAKLPDEVVRRIELPARKAPAAPGRDAPKDTPSAEPAVSGQKRASEARQAGREMAERAKELGQEAAEQREEARRSRAEERRRNDPPGPPAEPPGRPPRPPRP